MPSCMRVEFGTSKQKRCLIRAEIRSACNRVTRSSLIYLDRLLGIYFKDSGLVQFQRLILLPFLVQGIFYALHNGQDLFLLESSTDDLHCYRQTMHLARIIMHIRAFRNAVRQRRELEVRG